MKLNGNAVIREFYRQEVLAQANEDLSVKNSYGKIIQFKYGDDGYHYSKIESQSLDMLFRSFEELEESHRFSVDTNWELFLEDEVIDKMTQDKKYLDKLEALPVLLLLWIGALFLA